MAALGDDPIREWILTEGKATQIKGTRSIGGGCINSAQRYDTDAGPFFVKTNRCAKKKTLLNCCPGIVQVLMIWVLF